MATNRDIVATRKLNKKNKARLGRGGDTKIRKVEGRDSHVNALEAYLIDVNNKAGEDYAKRVGAGTTNPLTGMPEYHPPELVEGDGGQYYYGGPHDDSEHTHTQTVDSSMIYNADHDWGQVPGELQDWQEQPSNNNLDNYQPLSGRQDYEALADLSPEDLEKYLKSEFGMGEDSMQYIEGFKTEPFGFTQEEKTLTTDRATDVQRFTERGLTSAYGATMGGLASQQATLGRATGRGLGQAAGAASMAASRSGLATSGSIAQGLETQKRGLFQDFTAGTKDVRRERGTALETLTLGKEMAGATKQYTTDTADLTKRKADYFEQKRQLDELYADVAAVSTVTTSDKRLKENIDYIGDSPSGIKMYEFNYLNNDTRHRGVMADDLVDSHPKALSKDEDGYYMVDYSQIDVNFEIVKGD